MATEPRVKPLQERSSALRDSSFRAVDDQAAAHLDDLSLVRAALAGNRDAADRLASRLDRITRIVRALAPRLAGRSAATERADLAQECFTLVWSRLPAFAALGPIEAFAYRCCVRVIRRTGERARRAPSSGSDPVADLAPTATAPPNAIERDELFAALRGLPPAVAAVIELKHFRDLTFAEIGAALHTSPNSAKSRYYRGLELLRNALDGAPRRYPPAPNAATR